MGKKFVFFCSRTILAIKLQKKLLFKTKRYQKIDQFKVTTVSKFDITRSTIIFFWVSKMTKVNKNFQIKTNQLKPCYK